ncbi:MULTISPECIES: YlbG family protein [unclassified Enterococcus]|uniref:YlbG family protein n=1 Tax=unclassified Enterococcus TaxID=2608891 RepID=UPI0015540081|nr:MULTISPECIES: YlbG family protein [unclassified Enterococcus]MBS7576143.1 YlbG family protein [Enterococcus sp. MMGLQ5-2]MBS7583376.1 YlbG family protein [Enterococcus sp. MMGLQ5-1]NPD11236.1 YlbG family protein [Enterococcus sp. MMGLQ5-1]NPD35979.1 YlbG family protein [Enterococcus sp. MMGLQ5-2]
MENVMSINQRRLIAIYFYNPRFLKNLKRFGEVFYISRKLKYALMYVDESDLDKILSQIQKLHFVREVEKSYRPDIEMNFADRIGKFNFEEDDRENQKVELQLKINE